MGRGYLFRLMSAAKRVASAPPREWPVTKSVHCSSGCSLMMDDTMDISLTFTESYACRNPLCTCVTGAAVRFEIQWHKTEGDFADCRPAINGLGGDSQQCC